MKMLEVKGNTYPVKDQIKALGGKWDATKKVWLVPDYNIGQANLIVAKGSETQKKKPFRYKKCVVCGVVQTYNKRGYPNVKIYRNGECQDCYEERKMGY